METTNLKTEAITATAELDLADWRRRVFELYSDVRAAGSPREAWDTWRRERDRLFRGHPQSPLAEPRREEFSALAYYPYDPAARVYADVVETPPRVLDVATSTGESFRFRAFAEARFALGCADCSLPLYWLEGYGGGVFVPFADGTNGGATYGAGRYLLDTVKGADLGMAGDQLVLDFNFAYNPSCAYDGRWTCPLAPAGSRLEPAVEAGERVPG